MIKAGSTFALNIAEIKMQFRCDEPNTTLTYDKNIEPFLLHDVKNIDLIINVHTGIPQQYKNCKTLYKAAYQFSKKDSNLLWNIGEIDNKRLIMTASPDSAVYPYQVTAFDYQSMEWDLYTYTPSDSQNDSETPIEAFCYPMGILILYYYITIHGGIMLHASGITDNNKGFIFSGFSGVGKSTMASLWLKKGAHIVNDDRLIIRKNGSNYYMYNTPMYYKDNPKKSLINNVFLLKQSPVNKALKLHGATAITRLLAFCVQHDYDKILIEKVLETITDLSSQIPIYELGFYPNDHIIKFLRQNQFA